MKLASQAYFDPGEDETPHIEIERLEAHGAGLIALTGGPDGPIDKALREGQKEVAFERLKVLEKIFGDRLYVEIQRHGLKHEIEAEPALLDLAYARALPIVATNEVYFASPDDYEAHDALLCIAEGTYVTEDKRRRLSREHFFKTAEQMAELFADLPEALANTIEIAKRCAFRPTGKKPILPRFVAGCAGHQRGGSARPRDGRAARPGRGRPEAAPRHHAAGAELHRGRLRQAARLRDRRHLEDEVPRLLPDRRRLHPVGQGQRHPRGAGARLGRRLGGGLVAHHHRPRSAPLRPAVRALPESRAHLDAGLRHRLLPGPPRRGDPLRAEEVRRRPRGADHHPRQAAGARRAARRRPRAADALRAGRQALQADPQQPRQPRDPRAGHRGRTQAAGGARQRAGGGAAAGDRTASSRASTATPPRTPPAW